MLTKTENDLINLCRTEIRKATPDTRTIAEMIIDRSLNLYAFIPQPKPPQNLVEFINYRESVDFKHLTKEDRWKTSDSFYKRDVIKLYLEKKWRAELDNESNFTFLVDMRGHLDPADQRRLEILDAHLTELAEKITGYWRPYKALQIDFKKYPFLQLSPARPELPPEPEALEWED